MSDRSAEKRKYYLLNKDIILKRNADYRKRTEYDKKYYEDNKEKIMKRNKQYKYNKLRTDKLFKLKSLLRCRINQALKNNYIKTRTVELIGCTIADCKLHLEKQFKQGMTWDNHGEWHIDHIKPCSSFDLSKENNQQECFNYKNLQPLWAEENLKKHNKYEVK